MHGGAVADDGGFYAGLDRRHAGRRPLRSVRSADFLAVALGLVVVGMAFPTLLDRLISDATLTSVTNALRTTWAMLFLGAGLLRLVRWTLTGEARTGLLGSATLVFGLLSAPIAILAVLIKGTRPEAALAPVGRIVAVAVTLWLLGRAIRSPAVDARVRPLRVVLIYVPLAWGVFALAAVASHVVSPMELSGHVWLALECVLAAGWLACSVTFWARAIQRSDASLVWTATALLIMTGAEITRGLAFVTDERIALYSTALQLVTGAIVLANATADLGAVLSADGTQMLSLSGALRRHERFLADAAVHDQLRRHDARSMMTALKVAALTLDRYDERIDPETKRQLRRSVISEVDRLAVLFDEGRREPVERFALREALAPLIDTERANGLDVSANIADVEVSGRRLEVVAVFRDVLANARLHAPGSPVSVWCEATDDGRVRIFVQDRGPGIRSIDREKVFLRSPGQSHRSAGGRNLGMSLARELMREQGGDIEIRRALGGGATFVISVPAESVGQPGEDHVEIGNSSDPDR